MGLVRIRDVVPLEGFRLRLTLTDGRVIERDVASLLVGPIFEPIRSDHFLFLQVRAQEGTLFGLMVPTFVPMSSFGVVRPL